MSQVSHHEVCNCGALRRASRHLTQLYEQYLAPFGLTVSQYGLMARLVRGEPRSIQELAQELGVDRTTLARNLKPLERDYLVWVEVDPADRRSRSVTLTEQGREVIQRAKPAWAAAQQHFEQSFGRAQAAALRALLQAVSETELPEQAG